MDDERLAIVRSQLERDYAGVFAPGQVEAHIDGYVALEPARPLVELVNGRCRHGAHVLDIGCGYGSFVTEARSAGLDAIGIDTAEFEIDFARDRLAELRPNDPAELAFRLGDGRRLPFGDGEFDAVTLWNVLEHVPDYRALLTEAARVLAPGGWLFVIAPNYAAFRREAHYHVPWLPMLPRRVAGAYLRAVGRDPGFFRTDIFYCTNRGVRREIANLRLRIIDRRVERLEDPARIARPSVRRVVSGLQRVGLGKLPARAAAAIAANPLRRTIAVEARKAPGAEPFEPSTP